VIEIRTPGDDDWLAVSRADYRAFGHAPSVEEENRERPLIDLARYRMAVDRGDVVGVAVGDEEMGRRHPLALDRLQERLERRAAVHEDRCSSRLVSQQEGVREPPGMHAPLDDHVRRSYGRSPARLGESRRDRTTIEEER